MSAATRVITPRTPPPVPTDIYLFAFYQSASMYLHKYAFIYRRTYLSTHILIQFEYVFSLSLYVSQLTTYTYTYLSPWKLRSGIRGLY